MFDGKGGSGGSGISRGGGIGGGGDASLPLPEDEADAKEVVAPDFRGGVPLETTLFIPI
jgi:hypothetical protein